MASVGSLSAGPVQAPRPPSHLIPRAQILDELPDDYGDGYEVPAAPSSDMFDEFDGLQDDQDYFEDDVTEAMVPVLHHVMVLDDLVVSQTANASASASLH